MAFQNVANSTSGDFRRTQSMGVLSPRPTFGNFEESGIGWFFVSITSKLLTYAQRNLSANSRMSSAAMQPAVLDCWLKSFRLRKAWTSLGGARFGLTRLFVVGPRPSSSMDVETLSERFSSLSWAEAVSLGE